MNGVMRTVVYVVDIDTMPPELFQHPPSEAMKIRFRIVTPCDARLVCDDDELVTRPTHLSASIENAINKIKIVHVMDVAALPVDDTITIQK
jgi:hypothetical protein